MRTLAATVVVALALAGAARADVQSVETDGFQVVETVQIKAAPDVVWQATINPGHWWNSQHSWSGDAGNLSLEPRAGGCLCEKLGNGGSAEHLRVVYINPGREIRLRGALGPLSTEGLAGGFVIKLMPSGGGTQLTWTYTVGGYTPGGAGKWAHPVDAVLKEQIERLQTYAEKGKM